jgi:hypothetical protein
MIVGHDFIPELPKYDKPNQKETLILFNICDD